MTTTTSFIDDVSLLLWLVAACLDILLTYAKHSIEPLDKLRSLAAPLACVAVPLTILGLSITLSWPLTGAANIIIGGPSLLFGFLLCMAAWLIARGEDLAALTGVARLGGIMLMVMAVAIVMNGLGAPPASEGAIGHPPIATLFSVLWATAYMCVGICAVISRRVLCGTLSVGEKRLIQFLLWVASIIFGSQAIISTLVHTAQFAQWIPVH
jgi:uncharacterized membrane protein